MNTVNSDSTVNDLLLPYSYDLIQEGDIGQQLAQFYMIVVEGGYTTLQSNTFDKINLIQGLIYLTGGKNIEMGNTFSNSNFRYTPVIYYLKQQIISFNGLTLNAITECTDCIQYQDPFNFLYNITSFNSFYLIENPTTSLDMSALDIEGVICTKCTTGIFGIIQNTKVITISQSIFKNCVSNLGTLYFGGTAPVQAKARRMLATNLEYSLTSCNFNGNKAQYGGAIYISYISLQLYTTTITSNQAQQQGGGVYFLSADNPISTFIINQSDINLNQAKVGGGVKIVSSFLQKKLNSNVINNIATVSGADTTSYPVGLKMFINNKEITINPQKQAIYFDKWVSGVTTNQQLTFYLTGIDGSIQQLDTGQTATLTVDFNYNILSDKPAGAKITGTTTANYDTTLGGFLLDKALFSQEPLETLLVKAYSSIIKIPQFDQTGSLLSINTNYILPIVLTMRKCIIGEAYISSTGICFNCALGTYSLVDDAVQCLECPKSGVKSCPGGSQINLDSGYWRPDASSDLIEQCFNQESNCSGGLNTGDSACSEGHVGALCEVCDITARHWSESYSQSSQFSCGKCSEITGNSLKMVGLSIYTIIAIFFSVKSTKALLDSYIITFYFQQAGFIQKKAAQSKESIGIIIKLFTTYIQLILVIQTFKLQLPPGLNEITANVGDPVQQMSFSMDCGLHQISGDIPMTYFRLMWSQLMPIVYVCIYLICHLTYFKIKKQKNRAVIAWISFIYIYISMQPSIVKSNIQTVSCRQISGYLYIQANVSEICYTSQHIKYMLLLIFPTFAVWIVLIPLYFLKAMYDGRHKLKLITMQYKFGFLYTEYKEKSYFWEIVKIYQKTLVTVFINIYDSYNVVKGVLVIFVLLIYIKFQQKYQPYLEKRFNDIDLSSNLTVVASIIVALFILDNPFSYLVWLGYIIIVYLNSVFILRLLRILISGYTQTLEYKLGNFYCKVSKRYPRLSKFLGLPKVPKDRINVLWKSFRQFVKVQFPSKGQTMVVQDIDIPDFEKKMSKKQLSMRNDRNEEHKQEQFLESGEIDDFNFKESQSSNQVIIRPRKSSEQQELTTFNSPGDDYQSIRINKNKTENNGTPLILALQQGEQSPDSDDKIQKLIEFKNTEQQQMHEQKDDYEIQEINIS